MITSFNGPMATVQNLGLEIARGRVQGVIPFGGVGRLIAAGAVTKNIIWGDGVFKFPNQTIGEDITFVSSNAADNVAGTGLGTIEVHYLDANLDPQVTSITLTGVTPVTGQLSGVRFIQEMHVLTAGTASAAVGNISAYKAGTATEIYALIVAGQERESSSARMVPNGKRAIIMGALGSSNSGTAAATTEIELVATELDTHQYTSPFIFISQGSIGAQDGGIGYNFPTPFIFKEGTIIAMRTTTDKGATIAGTWFGWLEGAV